MASVHANSDLLESFPETGTQGWKGRIFDNGTADNFTVVVICADQTP